MLVLADDDNGINIVKVGRGHTRVRNCVPQSVAIADLCYLSPRH